MGSDDKGAEFSDNPGSLFGSLFSFGFKDGVGGTRRLFRFDMTNRVPSERVLLRVESRVSIVPGSSSVCRSNPIQLLNYLPDGHMQHRT